MPTLDLPAPDTPMTTIWGALLIEGVHHRVRGALEVRPQCRVVEGRELEGVDGGAHVQQPAVPRIRVHREWQVPHAKARVTALFGVRARPAPVLLEKAGESLNGALEV